MMRNNIGIASTLKSRKIKVREPIDERCWAFMKALRERENRITNDKSLADDERLANLKEVRGMMREVQNTARKRYMDMKREQRGQ